MGESIKSDQSRLFRFTTAGLIGLAPIWTVLLIWDFTDQQDGWQIFVRGHSFVIALIELAVILVAMGAGFSPVRTIANLPRLTKIVALSWLPIVSIISFQSGNDHVSAAIGIMKLCIAALFLLALIELRRSGNDLLFGNIWLAVGCGMLFYILLWIIHIAITNPSGEEWVVQVPGVNNVRHIGHFAIAGFFGGIAALIISRDRPGIMWRWAIPGCFVILSLGTILWSGSRGPVLACLAAMVLLTIMGAGFRRQLFLFFSASILISTAAVSMLPVPHHSFGLARAIGFANPDSETLHQVSSGRTQLWIETVGKIKEKPVFGWGIEQYSKLGPAFASKARHPHNFPLQFLFSGGIVSAVLLLLIVFPALRKRNWPKLQGIGVVGTVCVTSMLFYSMYDGVLFFSYPIMIFLLAIATSISPQRAEPANDMSG